MDGINACVAYCVRSDTHQVALGLGSYGNVSLPSTLARGFDPKIGKQFTDFPFLVSNHLRRAIGLGENAEDHAG